jgi:septal ring factor EnvC (AmiA/AmiB activator)
VRVPSGKLCLTIHDRSYFYSDNFRKNRRDTKRKQLEDSLDAFVIGLIKRAAKKKEYRQQKEEEERKQQEMARLREEERQRQAELNRKIQEERKRVSNLITDAGNHQKSIQIRDFAAAVEKEHRNGHVVYVNADEYESWVTWARDQADRLDPLLGFGGSTTSLLFAKC